jgi:hypothetical protein
MQSFDFVASLERTPVGRSDWRRWLQARLQWPAEREGQQPGRKQYLLTRATKV